MRILNLTICLAVLFLTFFAAGCTQFPQNDEQDDNIRQQSSMDQHEDQDDKQNDGHEDNDNQERDND